MKSQSRVMVEEHGQQEVRENAKVKRQEPVVEKKKYNFLNTSDLKGRFPAGDHKVRMLIQITEFSWTDMENASFYLLAGTRKNCVTVCRGTIDENEPLKVHEGEAEFECSINFFRDGEVTEEMVKLELFVGEEEYGYCRLNLGIFESGKTQSLKVKKPKKGKIALKAQVKVIA